MKKKLLFILGTRPEAIKMTPLILEAQKHVEHFESFVCQTGQHPQMVEDILSSFGLKANFKLEVFDKEQALASLASRLLNEISKLIDTLHPDLVIVQGDTNSTAMGALAAFYAKIPIAHIEAGLRTNDLQAPYPEEGNRCMVSQIAQYHFAPTTLALHNLQKIGITKNCYLTGNTGIDSLRLISEKLNPSYKPPQLEELKNLLITTHRRENFGEPIENLLHALVKIKAINPALQSIFIEHPNPAVKEALSRFTELHKSLKILQPLPYVQMVEMLLNSQLIITDSGGLQEEAAYLGIPTLVFRSKTERMAGIRAGNARLLIGDSAAIFNEISELIQDKFGYNQMSRRCGDYGKGDSSKLIMDVLMREFI